MRDILRLRNILMWSAAIAFVCGCAGGQPKGVATDRKAGMPGYPSAQYMTATGLGQSESEARNQAVAELSRIFESKVRSETLDRVKLLYRSSGEETSEQRLDSRIRVISNVELAGVEIAKTWKQGNTCYALAVLDRSKARDNWVRELKDIDRKIEGGLDAISRLRSRLLRYRALKGVTGLWLKREVLLSRLTVIGAGQQLPPSYDMKQVFETISGLKASMPVFIDMKGWGAEQVEEAVAGTLGAAGFVVTENRGEAAVLVEGKASEETVGITHPDWEYARARVSLSVVDADEGVSVGEVSENRRASHLTYDEAARKALRSVLPDVAEGVLKYLEQGTDPASP